MNNKNKNSKIAIILFMMARLFFHFGLFDLQFFCNNQQASEVSAPAKFLKSTVLHLKKAGDESGYKTGEDEWVKEGFGQKQLFAGQVYRQGVLQRQVSF
ncbi:MAG: hypothetical protein ACOX6W_18465 [Lentisphaeria bacterium]